MMSKRFPSQVFVSRMLLGSHRRKLDLSAIEFIRVFSYRVIHRSISETITLLLVKLNRVKPRIRLVLLLCLLFLDQIVLWVVVYSARLIRDQETQRPKGFDFVTFESEVDSRKALEGLDGKTIDGILIFVEVAKNAGANTKAEDRE